MSGGAFTAEAKRASASGCRGAAVRVLFEGGPHALERLVAPVDEGLQVGRSAVVEGRDGDRLFIEDDGQNGICPRRRVGRGRNASPHATRPAHLRAGAAS